MTSRIAYCNPDTDGAFDLAYHYEMLADERRLAPLRRAVTLTASDKRVLESGAGSGVLSILAARAGARIVYATEKDPTIAHFLRQNLRAAGCEAIVRVIEKDTRCVTLDDLDGQPVDVVIAEHLSTWQVIEPQTSIMNYVNRHLAKDDAVRIPECAFNRLELVNSRFRFQDVVDLRTHYVAFSGMRRPTVLSAAALASKVDFARVNDLMTDLAVTLAATRGGVLNSVMLTSPLRVLGGISFRTSDSLLPPVVVPLASDLTVRGGDVVSVRVRYRCETTWNHVHCEAQRIGSAAEVVAEQSEARAAAAAAAAEMQ